MNSNIMLSLSSLSVHYGHSLPCPPTTNRRKQTPCHAAACKSRGNQRGMTQLCHHSKSSNWYLFHNASLCWCLSMLWNFLPYECNATWRALIKWHKRKSKKEKRTMYNRKGKTSNLTYFSGFDGLRREAWRESRRCWLCARVIFSSAQPGMRLAFRCLLCWMSCNSLSSSRRCELSNVGFSFPPRFGLETGVRRDCTSRWGCRFMARNISVYIVLS